MEKPCKCGIIAFYALEEAIPINHNFETNAYDLIYQEGECQGKLRIRYCFSCGEKLPEPVSKTLSAEKEVADFQSLRDQINTVEQMKRLFGEPDQSLDVAAVGGKIGRMQAFFDQEVKVPVFAHTYSRRYRTLVVSVNEYGDGTLELFCYPKPQAEAEQKPADN